MKRRALGLLCALALLCTLACPAALASASGAAAAEVRERPGLPDVHVYLCSLLSGRAYRHGDAAYMSLTDIGALYNIDVTVSVTNGSFTASAPALEVSGEKDSGYITANSRYLYLPDGYIVCGGDVYLPMDAICRIFGISAKTTEERVDISTAQARIISGGEDYYETHFPADELYWLPRIAYAEAFEQPLAGLMGVCAVVKNRVADEDFPDTVFDVLYDVEHTVVEHTVQFTPVTTGSMRSVPPDIYFIAAYLVLEGYNPVGDSVYFVNPANNGNYWFRENLTYVATIGGHEFYKK